MPRATPVPDERLDLAGVPVRRLRIALPLVPHHAPDREVEQRRDHRVVQLARLVRVRVRVRVRARVRVGVGVRVRVRVS